MSKKRKNKNKTIIISSVALVAVALIAYFIYFLSTSGYVATVAGEKITRAEYKFFLGSIRGEMESAAGLKDDAGREAFWNSKPTGNTDAKELAKNEALDRLKEFEIQIMRAKEKNMKLSAQDLSGVDSKVNGLLDQMAKYYASKEKATKMFPSVYNVTVEQYREILRDLTLVYNYAQSEQETYKVTDEDIKNHYEKKKDDIDEFEVRQLFISKVNLVTGDMYVEEKLKESEEKANALLTRAKSEEDFVELVKKNTEDKSFAQNQGILTKETMSKEIMDWVLKAKINDVSMVETSVGWHIVKLEKRTGYDEKGKERAKNSLLGEMYEKKLEEWSKDPKYDLKKNNKELSKIRVY